MVAPPALLVPAPAFTPSKFGLQSAADQAADADPRMRLAGITWEPNPCALAHLDPAECGDDPTELELTEGIGAYPVAPPITVYAGFTCSPVDLAEDKMRARATAALAGDWAAVEAAVWGSAAFRLMDDTDGSETAVLAEDPVSITRGVGLLEAYLGAGYAGVGVIHAPRAVAAHAANAQLIAGRGSYLTTPLDNRWAFGSGYPNTGPDGELAAAGTTWLVVTGAVVYRRTGVNHRRTREQAFDRGNNVLYAVADRTYAVGWDDCVRAAVPITLT